MLPTVAAGAIIVLGIVIAFAGFLDGGGNMLLIVIGIVAVAIGGLLGMAARRQPGS